MSAHVLRLRKGAIEGSGELHRGLGQRMAETDRGGMQQMSWDHAKAAKHRGLNSLGQRKEISIRLAVQLVAQDWKTQG